MVARPTIALSKSSTLTMFFQWKNKVPSAWKGRETYMLLIGSDPRAMQKDAGLSDLWVFLLPDQIKRDKGVWWMPWQQEAMKDVILCDKPWGAENKL